MATRFIGIEVRNQKVAEAAMKASPQQIQRASYRAIEATLDPGRERVVRRIRSEVGLRADLIREKIELTRTNPVALVGFIRPTSRATRVSELPHRVTDRGVEYNVRRGKRVFIRSAFVVRGMILRRARRPGSRRLVGRLPVYLKYGPSMHELTRAVYPRAGDEIQELLAANFGRALSEELKIGRSR